MCDLRGKPFGFSKKNKSFAKDEKGYADYPMRRRQGGRRQGIRNPFINIEQGVTEDAFTKSRRTYSEYNNKFEHGGVVFGAEYEAFKQPSNEKFATPLKR